MSQGAKSLAWWSPDGIATSVAPRRSGAVSPGPPSLGQGRTLMSRAPLASLANHLSPRTPQPRAQPGEPGRGPGRRPMGWTPPSAGWGDRAGVPLRSARRPRREPAPTLHARRGQRATARRPRPPPLGHRGRPLPGEGPWPRLALPTPAPCRGPHDARAGLAPVPRGAFPHGPRRPHGAYPPGSRRPPAGLGGAARRPEARQRQRPWAAATPAAPRGPGSRRHRGDGPLSAERRTAGTGAPASQSRPRSRGRRAWRGTGSQA